MTETPTSTENYLKQLASELEALGPAETDEVVAEIRAHLAEAISDAGHDEGVVFARFGSPDALAARILEERGVLASGPGIPEVPGRTRALAFAVDAAEWAVGGILVYMVLAIPIGLTAFGGWRSALPIATALVMVALPAVSWFLRRRKPTYASTGMRLLGLRRIRVGAATRLVRERDIPGLPRQRKLFPLFATAIAILLIVVFGYSIAYSIADNNRSRAESKIQDAVTDTSIGMAVVSGAYQQILAGSYSPTTHDSMTGVIQRRTSGKVETYAIESAEIPDVQTYATEFPQRTSASVVLVTVDEFTAGSETPSVYQYRVSSQTKSDGNQSSGGTWVIESAKPVQQ
jgi:uncharacterized membrane protein